MGNAWGLVSRIESFLALDKLVQAIVSSEATWDTKYELIFHDQFFLELDVLGFQLDWRNPDTSYEDSVLAFARAMAVKATELEKVLAVAK